MLRDPRVIGGAEDPKDHPVVVRGHRVRKVPLDRKER